MEKNIPSQDWLTFCVPTVNTNLRNNNKKINFIYTAPF